MGLGDDHSLQDVGTHAAGVAKARRVDGSVLVGFQWFGSERAGEDLRGQGPICPLPHWPLSPCTGHGVVQVLSKP